MTDETDRCVVDANGVRIVGPNGTVSAVAWSEVQSVVIKTTDAGPFDTDFFWVLRASGGRECVVPQDLPGEEDLLPRLQDLPDFDNEAVIEASGCAVNRAFLCWKRV